MNRTTLGKQDTKVVARGRPGTRISAAALGPDHAVVAMLDVRHTTEGEMTQAFVTLDDGETVRLSDEGAGATSVRLVARGDRAAAIYIDARTSMIPLHARMVGLKQDALSLESDVVLFVGGPPERSADFAVTVTGRALFALLPVGRDASAFGMAAVPVVPPFHTDVTPTWSMYPNGLDPAPIAGDLEVATLHDAGGSGGWVARVRPEAESPGSARVLELGRIDEAGVFEARSILARNRSITDIALASDTYASVWILYGDATTTWLERRVCM